MEERERERGGCHPWLPLITHSLMTLFFFLLPLLFRGRGGGREFGRRPIKQGHTEFTTSRWDCPPPGKCLCMCVAVKSRLDQEIVYEDILSRANLPSFGMKVSVRIKVYQVVVKVKTSSCAKKTGRKPGRSDLKAHAGFHNV